MRDLRWNELFIENMGKILGALAGLILGIIFIKYGFFKGLFILICTAAGIYLGSVLEKSNNWEDFLKNLWPPDIKDW